MELITDPREFNRHVHGGDFVLFVSHHDGNRELFQILKKSMKNKDTCTYDYKIFNFNTDGTMYEEPRIYYNGILSVYCLRSNVFKLNPGEVEEYKDLIVLNKI